MLPNQRTPKIQISQKHIKFIATPKHKLELNPPLKAFLKQNSIDFKPHFNSTKSMQKPLNSFKNNSISHHSRNYNVCHQSQSLSNKGVTNLESFLISEYNTKPKIDNVCLPRIQSPRCIEMTNPLDLSFGKDCNIGLSNHKIIKQNTFHYASKPKQNENEDTSNKQTQNTCYTSQVVNLHTEIDGMKSNSNCNNNQNEILFQTSNIKKSYIKKLTYSHHPHRSRKSKILLLRSKDSTSVQGKDNINQREGKSKGDTNKENTRNNNGNNLLIKSKTLSKYPTVKYSSQQIGKYIKCYAVNSYQGTVKETNEDKVSIILQIAKPKKYTSYFPCVSYFAIFDGYNGNHKSNFLRDNLHKYIILNNNFPNNVPNAIKEGYIKSENEYKKQYCSEDIEYKSDSYIILSLICDNCIYIANFGTSLALVSINNGNKVKLIQNSDDINIIDLSEETIDFIIFGSAGLYEKYKYDECFTSVWKYINKKNVFKYENIHSFSGGIVDHLIKTAMKKGSYENISCLFLGFDEFFKKYEEIKTNIKNDIEMSEKKVVNKSNSIKNLLNVDKDNNHLITQKHFNSSNVHNFNYYLSEKKQMYKLKIKKTSFIQK